MPSGYEKSKDYGGSPPGKWGVIVTVATVALLVAIAFSLQ
jgi:hypothetical protein